MSRLWAKCFLNFFFIVYCSARHHNTHPSLTQDKYLCQNWEILFSLYFVLRHKIQKPLEESFLLFSVPWKRDKIQWNLKELRQLLMKYQAWGSWKNNSLEERILEKTSLSTNRSNVFKWDPAIDLIITWLLHPLLSFEKIISYF